jgi:hypothetical protein
MELLSFLDPELPFLIPALNSEESYDEFVCLPDEIYLTASDLFCGRWFGCCFTL